VILFGFDFSLLMVESVESLDYFCVKVLMNFYFENFEKSQFMFIDVYSSCSLILCLSMYALAAFDYYFILFVSHLM
jgi:hypothetical protein